MCEIAYQNKDITSKLFAERFQGKSLKVYGLNLPPVRQALPTNIPQIMANELKIDNVFLLEDNTIAVIDYESDYKKRNKHKYVRYVNHVSEHYGRQWKKDVIVRMIVIYTADVEKAPEEFSAGCLTLKIEQAFLRKIDSETVQEEIREKLALGLPLSDDELMKLIILPLTYKGKEKKKQAVKEAVELAKKIADKEEKAFVLSGILVFADKIIDTETAKYIKEVVRMTQVAELLLEEGREEGRREGRQEGLILSGKIFRVVSECSDLTNERIAEEVGCSVEEVESTRKMFDI